MGLVGYALAGSPYIATLLDAFADGAHGLLPCLVGDVEAAQAEDAGDVDAAFLVDLEGVVDAGAGLASAAFGFATEISATAFLRNFNNPTPAFFQHL